jgi:hypothetical protein
MRAKWVQVASWSLLAVFAGAMFVLPVGLSRGWFTQVSDDWTHIDFANHLKRRGVEVQVTKEIAGSDTALFTDGAGAKVAVIKCRDSRDAEIQDRTASAAWVEHFSAGPFFVGTSSLEGVNLCRRIERAVK